MAADNTILSIIRHCLAVDQKAVKVYQNFSKATKVPALQEFWKQMSKEEGEHVGFWRQLEDLAAKGLIPQVFQEGERIEGELSDISYQAEELLKESGKELSRKDSFLLAFRLEFYLLHPALISLFRFVTVFDEQKNPVDTYEAHINGFIEAFARFGQVTPEMELLGETLMRLWKENKLLADRSTTDELTGILNRRGFLNVVTPLSYLAQRNGYTVGVMMLDIDHFKKVNDTHGHKTGDRTLALIASAVQEKIRHSDVLGRFGGEEFIVFVNDIDRKNLAALAENIRTAVRERSAETPVPVTVSIGLAMGRLEKNVEEEFAALMYKADEYLYQAKGAGRNRVAGPDG